MKGRDEVKKVYESYKHLDKILSDEFLMGESDVIDRGYIFRVILYKLWKAIKKDLEVD